MSGTLQSRIAVAVLIVAFLLPPSVTADWDVAPGPRGSRDEPSPPRAPVARTVTAAHAEPVDLWFVEFSSPPTASGGLRAATLADKQRFRAAALQAGLEFHERYAFDRLWNGLSIRIDVEKLGQLRRVPGVVALYPVEVLQPDPEPEDGVDLFNALSMTGADLAQDDLGLTGSGVRVGIVDTGVDYDHPDLGGCFGPGCRVETGWDFVGDEFTGASSTAAPDPDPDDACRGHGTHVAGIVGADGELRGVAPRVTFGAYRVFGCTGSTTADVMIAAMERALEDGMDVVNMSIGSARQWPQYPAAVAADHLVDKGVVVVASFGNSGSEGLYAGGAPAVGAKVIGVASLQNGAVLLPSFEAAGRAIPYDTMTFAPDPPELGSEEIVYIGRACDADPLLADPAGKVALAVRGDCFFRDKALKAFAAGATAVLVHNNRFGMVFGTVQSPALSRPVAGITQADGLYLRGLQSPVEITWTPETAPAPIEGGGLVNSFSSFGPSPDLLLKPDLAAPGGSIYSTYPLERGSYATLSGTSMAAPHVAGAAALLLQARPHFPARAVRDVLQNSADPVRSGADPAPDSPELVHRQGAGILDIDDAILAAARITPAQLSLGEVGGLPVVRSVEVVNESADPMTFDLSHEPALSTNGVIAPSTSTAAATVSFSSPSVALPPGGTAFVQVTLRAPLGLSFGLFGGHLVFSPRDGGPVYRVPYAGFAGDYQAIPTMTPTLYGWPWLSALTPSGAYQERPFGEIFSLQGDDLPRIVFHLEHQIRRLLLEVFDAASGRDWHRAHELEYFPRNGSSTGFWSLTWDGTTFDGDQVFEVPNGTYRLRLSVQKALGDDDDPRHWESWTSPPVKIARPAPPDPEREQPGRDTLRPRYVRPVAP